MTDQSPLDRRRVLELSGVGVGIAAAGCLGQTDDAGAEREAVYQLTVDQEAIQEETESLQQQVEDEEISEEEAQEDLSALESELREEAIETARSDAEELGLTVEDDAEVSGVQGTQQFLLAAGEATALLDMVETETAQALLPGAVFEQVQQQQEAAEQQQEQAEQEGTNDSENDSE